MQNHPFLIAIFSLSFFLVASHPVRAECSSATDWTPGKPSQKVATLLMTWHDSARNREIPVKIYYPANAKAPCPLIIFSHGLGGSRLAYGYLGEHWAGAGYIVAHIQHLGSDDAVWRGAGLEGYAQLTLAAANPLNAQNRAEDVSFAITKLLALNHQPGFCLDGLINEDEIAVAGHSFGAWTALAVVGEKNVAGLNFTDPRVKAAIAMSAPVPGGAAKSVGEFTSIAVPVFHMTGTRDDSPIGETKAADRRIPYDQSSAAGTCLLTLNGADHMTFSGHMFNAFAEEDAHFQKYILAGSTAFWDATLRGNKSARAWLYGGGFKTMLAGEGTFESR